ncbi:chromosomal replication initiator protein DnaA [Candidatus Saccharibacteria bacterium]|nr:chromosomal replication initiator protein DnaA [Candidatus Saccharibacteria bacterium]
MPNQWQTVLDEIKSNVSDMAFNTYFGNVSFCSEPGDVVILKVPNVFIGAQIEKKYKPKILKALSASNISCKEFRVVEDDVKNKSTVRRGGVEIIDNNEETGGRPTVTIDYPTPKPQKDSILSNGLNPKFRLSNYIIGNNNDLAVSAAQHIINNPGGRYNPFFLYGGSGLGKTHLIQAIGNELLELNPKMKIRYATIEEFYTDFVNAMKNKIDGWAKKWRDIDVLIIDDFQFIEKKEASQKEFFHTFNELYRHDKQVIVACDRLPSQIKDVDPRLAGRLTMGVPVDIQLPDFETRCAILYAKAELIGAKIDSKTVEYLAENIKTSVRDLEGELNRILLLAEVRGVPTSEIIGSVDPIHTTQKPRISAKQIIDKVAKYYGFSSKDILGTKRTKDIKNARNVAIYLIRDDLGLSTPAIGKEFQKDHSTIINSLKVINKSLKLDFSLREQISEIRSKLNAN